MLVLNFTAVLILISFALFVVLMRALFFEPIARLQARREAQMAEDRHQADRLLASYFQLDLEVKAADGQIQQEALTVVQQARQEAKQQAADRLAAVREEGLAAVETARGQLDQQRDAAIEPLHAQARQLSDELARRLLAADGAAAIA